MDSSLSQISTISVSASPSANNTPPTTTPTTSSANTIIPGIPGPGPAPGGGLGLGLGALPPDGYYYANQPRRSIHPAMAGAIKPVSKSKRCTDECCTPSILFLLLTLLLTSLASALLAFALTTQHWELMRYDKNVIKQILANESSGTEHVTVLWLFDDQASKIIYGNRNPPLVSYLLPIHSGVWTSCIDVLEEQYQQMVEDGYDRPFCIDHLQQNVLKPNVTADSRASWQHRKSDNRMQNLAIACAMVCLILLSAAILVGLFGICRPQVSAVLVTGVIYVLAAIFALFTLTIVHLKHKNRKMFELLDIWTRLIDKNEEFQQARVILYSGWSFKLGWAGTFACIVASVMWILLSKIMRYNPKYI